MQQQQQIASPTGSASSALHGRSRPSTAEQRLRELNGSLRARHASEHRGHFFGGPLGGALRPNSAVKPPPPPPDTETLDAQRLPAARSATWSAASDAGGTRPALTDDAHRQNTMGRMMSNYAARAREQAARAQQTRETDRRLQAKLDEMPWWRRIVMDEAFRRRVATVAARALRTEEDFFRSDEDAQYIALPPLFRWEAMSADNRVVQPTPGAPCGPLDGVTHRWRGVFPPNGFVQLTPNVSNLRPVPEKKGPLHINVFIPTRGPTRSKKEDPLEAAVMAADGGDDDDASLLQLQSTLTIGQRVAAYEEAQRRKVEEDMEARRLQREMTLGHSNTRGKMAVDDEGCLTVDGVRLEQRYVGTIRPSFLLIRWRILCNALHQHAASSAGMHIGRGGGGSGGSGSAVAAAGGIGGSSDAASRSGGAIGSPRRPPVDGSSLVAGHTPTVHQPPPLPNDGSTGPPLPVWLEGVPHSPMPVFRVETRPPLVTIAKDTDTKRIEAFPPDPLSFASIRREDISDARRQSLFHAVGCRKAVHRIFLQLPQDATGRLHQVAYVTFVLNLLNVFLPMFHAQSNIEVAEDEWLCRGTPEFPDFNIFYHNFFDIPLILSREKATMTEDVYVAVWDLLFEALHGRDKLLAMYEAELQRSQHLLLIQPPPPTPAPTHGDVVGDATQPTGGKQWWWAYLPSYLDPTNEASQLQVPRRINSDQYDLHLISQQVKLSAPLMQQADPGRRTFIMHRLASAKLANRTAQASRVGSPEASFRGSVKRRQHNGDAASVEHGGSDDDGMVGSPVIEGEDDFPSLAFQARKLLAQEQQQPLRHQQLTEKQREEARRINAMLSVENKASSLTLFEEVYETTELARDEVDEILDYLSDVSASDLVDTDGAGDGDEGDGAEGSGDSEGAHLSESETSGVHRTTATKRRQPKSIRRMYEEAKREEDVRVHAARAADEAAKAERRLLAGTRRKSDAGKARSNSFAESAKRNNMLGAALTHARPISPTEGALYSVDSLASLRNGAQHSKRPRTTTMASPGIDAHRAEAIRSRERMRVRQLACGATMVAMPSEGHRSAHSGDDTGERQRRRCGNNNRSPTRVATGGTAASSTPAAHTKRLQYRTFQESHLKAGSATSLDATTPEEPQSGGARHPLTEPTALYSAPSQGATAGGRTPLRSTAARRPGTATSAHASMVLNPFQRMSTTTKRLLASASSSSGGDDNRPPRRAEGPQDDDAGVATAARGGTVDPTVEQQPSNRRTAPSSATSSALPSLYLSSSASSTRQVVHPSTFVPPSSYPPMTGGAADARRRELLAALIEVERDNEVTTDAMPPEDVNAGGGAAAERSPNGGPPVRRPRMPSFMRHNNQTQARQQLGDLRTSALSALGSPPSQHLLPSTMSLHPSMERRRTSSGDASPCTTTTAAVALPPSIDITAKGASCEPAEVAAARRATILASRGSVAPPTSSVQATRGAASDGGGSTFQTRSASIQVTPIRPPKYRYPRFHGPAQPPDTLYLNGHMLHKQHPAMSLVQRIHLGGVQAASAAAGGGGDGDAAPPDATAGPASCLSSPRPLGQGVPSPRTALTALNRTVIVVPTGSARDGSRQQVESSVSRARGEANDAILTVARMSVPSS